MSASSQQYAGLADDSYSDKYPSRIFPPKDRPKFVYEEFKYWILEHYSNGVTGYQGTIYQRMDTGEIIVAHRGTEGDKKWQGWIKDGAVTDVAMVTSRVNLQARDALALTRRAVEYAQSIGRDANAQAPQVTVTGHSLGGTLAQYTAHYFNLKGETFNAYGAVSLGYRLPEGGNSVLNHVMAADSVSAASAHYGQVRVYATPAEIARLHGAGYANDRNELDPRLPQVAALKNLGSHSMHNFLNVDGEKRPDKSVLGDPAARQLAETFEPMIEKFRSDLRWGRGAVTAIVRDPLGRFQDGINQIRGPEPAGEPAARDEQFAQQRLEGAQRAAALEQRIRETSKPNPFFMSSSEAMPVPASIRRPDATEWSAPQRPYTLRDYTPPVQTSPRTRGHHDRRQEQAEERQPDVHRQTNDQAQIFPADHPSYPLYAALAGQLPGLPKEKIAEITVAAHDGRITSPMQLKEVIIHNDQVWVAGHIPGERAHVSLSTSGPSLPEIMQKIEAFGAAQTLPPVEPHLQRQSI
ncbi:MAG: hypothetical protein ABI858_01035 [Pseudoxanthomonas sp.]